MLKLFQHVDIHCSQKLQGEYETVTAVCAKALEQLHHTTQLNPERQSYTLNVGH